jgi:hypothetical protein
MFAFWISFMVWFQVKLHIKSIRFDFFEKIFFPELKYINSTKQNILYSNQQKKLFKKIICEKNLLFYYESKSTKKLQKILQEKGIFYYDVGLLGHFAWWIFKPLRASYVWFGQIKRHHSQWTPLVWFTCRLNCC